MAVMECVCGSGVNEILFWLWISAKRQHESMEAGKGRGSIWDWYVI